VFNAVAGTGGTFALTDIINGGAGVDTLSMISDNAATTLVGANLTSIEKISVNQIGAGRYDFAGVTGVTDLINNNSSADIEFGRDNTDAGNDVGAVAALTINGGSANTKITYSDTALAGTADVQQVNLNGYGSAASSRTLTILTETAATNELETLSLAATGVNGITLTTDGTQTSLKTINVTGAGSLALALAGDNASTSATTIDASANTGGVIIGGDTGTTGDAAGNALGAANHRVTLTAGNDTIAFGANLNASDTVAGGTGTDTLAVSLALTNALMTNVTGFEVIRFDAGGAVTQDAGITSMAGVSYQLVSAAQTYTLNNLANATSISVIGGAATTTAVALVMKDGSGLSDTLSVNVANGASNAVTTVTAINDVAGLETLNLSSTGGTGTNVITTLHEDGKVVLTGSAGLTITNVLVSTSFDATAFTGKLTAKAGNTATNIQSGTGADTITGGTGADTVNAGAGNDTINIGSTGITTAGADVITTGAGNDIINFTATQGATADSTSYAAFNVIKDFTVGTSTSASDFLQFSATDTNLGASDAGAAKTGLAKGATAAGLTAGDTMVVQSVAKDAAAVTLTANVSFIKLTTGVAFTTNIATTAKAAIGTATITDLAEAVYLVSMFDTTNNKMVLFTANPGASADNDTTLSTADFVAGTAASVHVVGVIDMTATDYAAFSATNLAVAST